MLEVEVVGEAPLAHDEIRRLADLAAGTALREDDLAHLAVAFVAEDAIAELNGLHRGKEGPTDVLSFPVDEALERRPDGPPLELGDVVICPPRCTDVREAVVHGVLHLVGMDHEEDDGEMLAVQAELLRW